MAGLTYVLLAQSLSFQVIFQKRISIDDLSSLVMQDCNTLTQFML